ncbi:MAG: DUF3320 domain-containing protein, partial [Gemmatimonadaceae bacterium]
EATAIIERGKELARLRERVARHFVPAVEEQEHAEDVAYVERKTQGLFGFLALLDGRYRAIRRRWTSYRQPSYAGSMIDQANEMKYVDRLRAERRAIAETEARARELFGGLWQGERSDWSVLESYVRWVVEFRGVCVRHGLSGRALETAAKPAPDVSDVDALRSTSQGAQKTLGELREVVGWPADYMGALPMKDIVARARELAGAVRLGPRWAAFEAARRGAAASLAGELVPLAMGGDVQFRDLASAFLRAFWLKWLTAAVQARPPLERFSTMTHEERVREFRELDRRVLLENQVALVGQLRDRVQNALREPEAAAQMTSLRRELVKQRNIAPLRRTMREAGAAVRAIKPCLMMSPLTAAQLLDGSNPGFDLVIFDEASQLPPEDAVGAIARGRQLTVVGDPKQLPPTTFFTATAGAVASRTDDGGNLVDEEGKPLVEDSESILEEYMGAGVPMSRLKWHYRSAHESLISFSNVQFYDADLYTFPSVETGTERYGLAFEYIPAGVYEGAGLNMVEARRVADEVIAFAREHLARRERGEAVQSLGVGTFNLRQQLAILDELEQRRRADPSVEPFFDRGAPEPFFVKNLENIQGDERDVIFLSVTYAKAADGRLRYNFGPLNGENGWRRLNVLTTRARQRMRVFSSMRGEEINPATTSSRGATLLREFLIYAERGRLESVSASLAAEAESPLERDVLNELTARGLTVVPQVGVAGYRIDIGVLDDAVPGRFLCGIECDGAAYHQSETARDRDRLRQEVLEQRGWTIIRLWSTDWFKDRTGAMERLLRLVDESRERARHQVDEDREERRRAEAEAARRAEEQKAAAEAERERAGVEAPYVRPVAAPYALTPGEGRYAAQELLDAPLSQVVKAIESVVAHESPVHEADVLARVAAMWGTRLGARIQAHVRSALGVAERSGSVRRRGELLWGPSDAVRVRSRAGTKIPAERIAPEEYRAAVLLVLGGGHGFSRAQLVTEVRAVLGYGRTGAALDEAIGGVIDALLAEGVVGEASTGIRLRR